MNADNEIVSPKLAEELEAKIQAKGGDILAVRHELEDQLHALEKKADTSEEPNAYRTDIALLLSEIEYLDQKLTQQAEKKHIEEKHPGLVARLREKLGL